jgi:hypothetical protein
MKKLTFLFLLISNLAFSQRITWQRELDFTRRSPGIRGLDFLNELLVQDTTTAFAFINTESSNPYSGGYYPVILKINPTNGALIDTIILQDDTASFLTSALNRDRQHIWLSYTLAGDFAAEVYRKVNYMGFTLARRVFDVPTILADSIGGTNKLVPAPDGGFYAIGAMGRTVNNRRVTLWQISRWDSLINRKWVREYAFEYTRGVPTRAEFLPNGNLFVSGYNGSNIQGIEVDTGNGRMLDRKILFSHPRGFEWQFAAIYRHPNGYFLSGREASSADSGGFNGFWNLQEQRRWARFRSLNYGNPETMANSTIWAMTSGSATEDNNKYENIDTNGNVLYSVRLVSPSVIRNITISKVQHFSNGSAMFGGGGNDFQRGDFLYFSKIDNYGTPYNPIYPPVGPVLTSNQKQQNQEPNLQVYPNPFTNTLRLSHKGTAQLLDVHGRVILSQPVEAGEELKVSYLPKGMYLLRLQSVGGKFYVRKVVRE